MQSTVRSAPPRRLLSGTHRVPFGGASGGALVDRIRSDEELAELVRQMAQREQWPYTALIARLAGAVALLDEVAARDVWILAVERRRTLQRALGRPVHLQVALFDALHDAGLARPDARSPPPGSSRFPAAVPALCRAPRAIRDPGALPLERRPVVVFATGDALLFADVHRTLADRGYVTLPARDAHTALTLAGLAQPRALLIDILLPPSGARRLLERLAPTPPNTHRLIVLPEGWNRRAEKIAPGMEPLRLPLTPKRYEAQLADKLGPRLPPTEHLPNARAAYCLLAAVASLCGFDGYRNARPREDERDELSLVRMWLGR